MFVLESDSCLVRVLRSNRCISGIDNYRSREVVAMLRVFCIYGLSIGLI